MLTNALSGLMRNLIDLNMHSSWALAGSVCKADLKLPIQIVTLHFLCKNNCVQTIIAKNIVNKNVLDVNTKRLLFWSAGINEIKVLKSMAYSL